MSFPNPVRSLFGPIFQREVRASGRRRGTYLLRALYAGGLVGVVGMAFWGVRMEQTHASTVQRIQSLQQLAPAMTMIVMWFELLAIALIAPMLASPLICDERRARTLATLLTTPLTSAELVLGKISSRLVQVVILILLTVPVLLAVRVFGGLNASVVVAFTCVALSVGFLGAALGLLYSIWHTRATSAALFALLTLALIQGTPPALESIITYVMTTYVVGDDGYAYHEQVLATASPYALFGLSECLMMGREIPWVEVHWPWLYEKLGRPGMGPPGHVALAPVWAANCLYNIAAALVIVGISIAALRRVMMREAGEALRAATAAPRRRRKKDQPATASPEAPADPDELLFASSRSDEATRDRASSRIVSDRPVLWRELRRSAIRARWIRIAIAIVAVGGIGALYAGAGIREEGLQMTFAVLLGLVVTIQSIFMTTGSIAAEREGRTWEVLLTTPLTGREIVLSKFLGMLRAQWFMPGIFLVHFVLSAIWGVVPWVLVLQVLLITLGPMLFFTSTGQFLSLAFRRGLTGAVLNLLLGMFVYFGLWILLLLAGWFGDFIDTDWWEQAAKGPWSLNPSMMAGSACDGSIRAGNVRFSRYDMADNSVSFLEFNTWLVSAFLAYAGLGAAVLGATIANFRHLSGRSS